MKDGVEMIFGIFNILGYFDKKAEGWRRGGYVYKIFVFLGLILLGAITLGFVVGAFACFKHVNDGFVQLIFLLLLGIICALCAVYCVFYFFVETISLITIISILIPYQRKYQKAQAESFKMQKKMEEASTTTSTTSQEQKYQFDAKDQYQKENLDELKPFKKPKRKKFGEWLNETSDQPYLKTKTGFDIAILVLTSLLTLGATILTIFACSLIN